MTDEAIITSLHLCCRYGGQPLLLWAWELQHNEGYRSMFTIVIVAPKNRRTTVSPSTGTHYMKMHGWVWCSNTSTRRSLWAGQNVTAVQRQWRAYFGPRNSFNKITTCDRDGIRSLLRCFSTALGWWLVFWPYSAVMCTKGTGPLSNSKPHITAVGTTVEFKVRIKWKRSN